MGPSILLNFRKKVCCGFLSPLKNTLPSDGPEPAKLGPNCKKANLYTTEEDYTEPCSIIRIVNQLEEYAMGWFLFEADARLNNI
jgi:hypothetical protein